MRIYDLDQMRRRALGTVATATFAIAMAGGCLPARAQAVYSFDIPRGDLAGVVTRIARTAGTQVAFPAGLASGRVAGPIRGQESVDSALAQALAGTGLQIVRSASGGLTIKAAATGAAAAIPAGADLAPIDVTDAGGIPGGSHGDEGFQPGDAGETIRIAGAPAREIPLTVSTVTQKVIASQVLTSAADAATNVAGVNLSSGSGSSFVGRPAFTIRGFTTGGYAVNGVEDRAGVAVPIDDVERVEVLKGPTSILTGASDDGGTVNVALKKPTDDEVRDVTVRYGSYNYKTLAVDLGGKVRGLDGVTYRFVGSGNNADNNTAGYHNPHEVLIAPSVRWQGDDLMVQAGLRYIDSRVLPDTQATVPFLASGARGPIVNEPRGVPLGNRDYGGPNRGLTVDSSQSYEVGRLFGVDVTLNNLFQHSDATVAYNFAPYVVGPATGLGSIQPVFPIASAANITSITEKPDITLKYDSAFAKQMLKFGYDYIQTNVSQLQGNGANQLIDVQTGLPPTSFTTTGANPSIYKDQTLVQGLYFIDKIDVLNDRLHIFGSVRHDDFTDVNSQTGVGFISNSAITTPAISWVAGGAFDLTPWMTIYGNRSNGFVPTLGVDVSGKTLPPEQRDLSEVGARYYLFDKRLTLTNSFYTLARTNVAIPDPTDPTGIRQILVGGQTTKGIEVEAQGEVFTGFNLIASFAVQNADSGSNASATGSFLGGIPNKLASVFATYTIQESVLKGLTFGGGYHYVASSLADVMDGGPLFRFPGYSTVNGVISYETKDYTISFKLDNVFNTYGYLNYGLANNVRIIPGRTALLQTTYHF